MSVRILNDYRVIFRPEHKSAMTSYNWNGWVYEHVFVAEQYLGRQINKEEIVHHLDGFRYNNRHQNLIVLLESEHIKLHEWMKNLPLNTNDIVKPEIKTCEVCGLILQDKQINTCSEKCNGLTKRKCIHPTKEELEHLISICTYVSIGKMFGVTDNAVRRWAKKYDLI
jgi:hypothetical protein